MIEVIIDADIAAISDQALIRHQNHLSIRTSPTPAPMDQRNFHASEMLPIR